MTPEQKESILKLVVVPGLQSLDNRAQVLQVFGYEDGQELAGSLLWDASRERSALDLELALIVAFSFGISKDHTHLLLRLATEGWHHSHEDLIGLIGRFPGPESVPVLSFLVEWVPAYLLFDSSRALAVKAIHVLGKVPGSIAADALGAIASSADEAVSRVAQRVAARRVGRAE